MKKKWILGTLALGVIAVLVPVSGFGASAAEPDFSMNTGYLNPTTNTATNTSGDGNGFEVMRNNAHRDDGAFAVDNNSGDSIGAACDSPNKDNHIFGNYGITLPAGATVTGVEVRLDAKVDSTANESAAAAAAGAPRMCVRLVTAVGGGSTTFKSAPTLSATEATYILGGASDNWATAWTPAKLANGNFRVRVSNVSSNGGRDFALDWVAVKVHYQ